MKLLPKVIRSIWLIALLAVFSFAFASDARGMSVSRIAYDGQGLSSITYDGSSVSAFNYDPGPFSSANEKENQSARSSGNFSHFTEFLAAETTVARNPNVYEALFEAPISGTTRSAQRASANNFLANQLQNDAQLSGMFNQELGGNVLQHMESGSGSGFLNPPGTVWHHPFDNPDVMQLLRRGEHTAPSLQPVLHPGGVGGFGNFYGP